MLCCLNSQCRVETRIVQRDEEIRELDSDESIHELYTPKAAIPFQPSWTTVACYHLPIVPSSLFHDSDSHFHARWLLRQFSRARSPTSATCGFDATNIVLAHWRLFRYVWLNGWCGSSRCRCSQDSGRGLKGCDTGSVEGDRCRCGWYSDSERHKASE